MLEEMSADTFQDWRRYYLVEPWGEERQDTRFALLGYAVCQALGMRGITFEAFLPVREDKPAERPGEQTAKQMVNIAHMIVAVQRGRMEAQAKCQRTSDLSSST